MDIWTLFRIYKNPPNFKKNDPSQIPSTYEEYSELISREKLVLWNEPCEKQSGSGAGRRQAAKLYIPSTIKSILMLWHTKWGLSMCFSLFWHKKVHFTIFSLLFLSTFQLTEPLYNLVFFAHENIYKKYDTSEKLQRFFSISCPESPVYPKATKIQESFEFL